jgi:hypothetical protein
VRDAAWLVALDLLAAVGVATLALVPAGSWSALLAAPLQVVGRTLQAPAWLVRGLAPLVGRGRDVGPAARGLVLTGVLLAVFVPLLSSADEGFADLLSALVPEVEALSDLPGRLVVGVVAAIAVAGAASTRLRPPRDPAVQPAARRLRRTSEWLLPLAALDVVLAAFLLAQRGPAVGTYADQVHAGFWQLLAVTALVLLVVAGTVRFVPRSAGVLAALAVLCVLTVVVDGSALSRLDAYTDAYGLTRLRIGVAAVCLSLGAVLLLVLVAGALRIAAAAVAHAVVLIAAVCLLSLTSGTRTRRSSGPPPPGRAGRRRLPGHPVGRRRARRPRAATGHLQAGPAAARAAAGRTVVLGQPQPRPCRSPPGAGLLSRRAGPTRPARGVRRPPTPPR